jgi:tRNA(His) 5'-end guanylyltransferase
MAYVQSDEISLLLTDFAPITTDAWFDGQIQKMASVSASIATAIAIIGGVIILKSWKKMR